MGNAHLLLDAGSRPLQTNAVQPPSLLQPPPLLRKFTIKF